MSNYNVNYTDIQTTPIAMQEGTENNTTLDIAIFGNTFLEYGQELNENILHLLENFACPMNAGNLLGNATPDTTSLSGSYNALLSRPTKGQIWYNTSLKKLYYWDGIAWRPISNKNDVAANWGVIIDGAQLPKPVSATSGYVFPYSECIWSVSPANFSSTFDYMACSTDSVATVNMKYRVAGSNSMTSGVANYLIIGIRGNTNHGTGFAMTPPVPSQTNTPTPTSSQTPSSSVIPASATPTPTRTPTPSTSLSQTPIPSGTAQPTPTPTPTHSPPANPCADAGGIDGCSSSNLTFSGSNDTGPSAISFSGHINFSGFFQSFFTYNITATSVGVFNHLGQSVGTITSITNVAQNGADVTGTINQGSAADNNGYIRINWSCTATENADHSVVCHSGALCNYNLPAWINSGGGSTPTPTPTSVPPSPTPTSTPAPVTPSPTPTPSNSPIQPLTLSSYSPSSLSLFGSCGQVGAGHGCIATTGHYLSGLTDPNATYSTINPTGGVPPYTYEWQYYAGSNSFSIVNPTSNSTAYTAGGTTPTASGGTCTGCSAPSQASYCPPSGDNITCAQVRCKVTDSIGTIIYSPVFAITFAFENTA